MDSVDADGFNVKLPAVVTVSATVVVSVVLPEVPVIVTVDVPAVAALLAVNVATLVPVVGLVPNAAVTPLGRPEAASVTLPVNPFTSVTVIVSVALPACVTERVEAEGDSVKVGVEARVPITIPRPFVPTHTVPYTCGSPVIAESADAYSCAESLICVHEAPSFVDAKIPRTPPI